MYRKRIPIEVMSLERKNMRLRGPWDSRKKNVLWRGVGGLTFGGLEIQARESGKRSMHGRK